MDNFFKYFRNAIGKWNESMVISSSGVIFFIKNDTTLAIVRLSGNMPVSNDWLIIMVNVGTISCFIIFTKLLLMFSGAALVLSFKLSIMLLTDASVTFSKTKRFL